MDSSAQTIIQKCILYTKFPGHGRMCDVTTEHSFVSQAMYVIDVIRLFFELLSTSVFTTRHWQTSGRLVQELNVYTLERDSNTRALAATIRQV